MYYCYVIIDRLINIVLLSMISLIDRIKHNDPTLIELGNSGNIEGCDIHEICEALNTNTIVNVLNLWRSRVGIKLNPEYDDNNPNVDRDIPDHSKVTALSNMLAVNKHLKILCLSGNYTNDEGIAILLVGLKTNDTLETLDLSRPTYTFMTNNDDVAIKGPITHRGAIKIADYLQSLSCRLKKLDLRNQWINNKGIIAIMKAMKVNASVIDLNVSNNYSHVQEEDDTREAVMIAIAEMLSVNAFLQILDVNTAGELTEISTRSLINGFNLNKSLTNLTINFHKIIFSQSKDLFASLGNHQTLQTLTVKGLDRSAGIDIALMISLTKSITHFNLCNNKLNDSVIDVFNALKNNSTIVELNCEDIGLCDSVGPAIGLMLTHNVTLKRLNLRSNNIGDTCIKNIAEGLAVNTVLKYIDLSSNPLTGVGIKPFIDKINPSKVIDELILSNLFGTVEEDDFAFEHVFKLNIPKLKLDHNNITEKQMLLMVEHLPLNKTIKSLNLCGNKLDVNGVHSLLKVLGSNNTFESLNLMNCNINDMGGLVIGSFLLHNRSIKHLDLSDNHIYHIGLEAIAKGLEHNTSLLTLNLNNNCQFINEINVGGSGNIGMIAFARALNENNTLQEFWYCFNKVHDSGIIMLTNTLRTNKSLTMISVLGEYGLKALHGLKEVCQNHPSVIKCETNNERKCREYDRNMRREKMKAKTINLLNN